MDAVERVDEIDKFINTVYDGLVQLFPQDRVEVGRHNDLYPDPDNKVPAWHNTVIIRVEFKKSGEWMSSENVVTFTDIYQTKGLLARSWIERIAVMRERTMRA